MRRAVITGLGALTPIGHNAADFWENLIAGTCGIDFITRFDTSDFKVKIGAEIKDFDPLIYMDKSEMRRSDPYTQYALAAACQAMEDSGLAGKIAPERLGVYVGSGVGGMDTYLTESGKLAKAGPRRVSPFFIPMMIANMAASAIAMRYQAQGPCLPVVTACATSTHCLGEALRAIRHGYADAILAGGAEATVNPLALAGFINCMALSTKNLPLESSLPFDKRRDGFVMGEGAGVLVVEEYQHAVNRGAKIYGELLGYGNTCDAYHITAPHPEALAATKAINLAWDEAKAAGADLDSPLYINAHGTGTPLNDKSETLALKNALGDKAYQAWVSSTKSMTGHMLGAAGAAEAIATVLALQEGIIPPTIGYQEKDPDCDLNYTPNQAVKAPVQLGLSISLGFGGHNACLALGRLDA